MNEIEQMLTDGAKQMGISLNETQVAQFMSYKDLLQQWNEKMNLTAIVDDREIVLKHFLDSLSLVRYMEIGESTSLIDVGTGAGFPAVPVKIVYPMCNVTLLDSLNKRLIFLDEVINNLGLMKINRIHLRAEDGGRKPELREQFDYSVARAVSRLSVLAELCLPYVKPGGFFFAMKGREVSEEMDEAKKILKLMGSEIADVKTVNIPFSDITHSIIMIKKYRQTPPLFPRNAAQITKSPIK